MSRRPRRPPRHFPIKRKPPKGSRYRSRAVTYGASFPFNIYSDGLFENSFSYSSAFLLKKELMHDYIKTHSQNPCAHEKILVTTAQWPSVSFDDLHHNIVLVEAPKVPVGVEAVMSPKEPDISLDFRRFQGNARNWFSQQFRSKVSLANYLFELKDLKQVLSRVSRSAASRSLNVARTELKDEIRDRKRSGIGGNFLDFTFNWKPLFEDGKKIFASFKTASQRFRFLCSNSEFREHYGAQFEIEPYDRGFDEVKLFDLGAWVGLHGGRYELWLVPDYCEVRFFAGASVSNKLNLNSLNIWDATADQLGLNNSPKIVWNALKFSWVVDFFVNSSNFWAAFEVQAAKGFLGVGNVIFSRRTRRFYKLIVRWSGETDSGEVEVGDVLCVTYDRDLEGFKPDSFISLDEDGLSKEQKNILFALADSQTGSTGRIVQAWDSTWGAIVRKFKHAR